MKKLLEIGAPIVIGAVVLNIIETMYFGCNSVAMSRAEELWDVIFNLLFEVGLTFMIVGFLINKKENE